MAGPSSPTDLFLLIRGRGLVSPRGRWLEWRVLSRSCSGAMRFVSREGADKRARSGRALDSALRVSSAASNFRTPPLTSVSSPAMRSLAVVTLLAFAAVAVAAPVFEERAVPLPGALIASHITSETADLQDRAVPLPGALIASHITSETADLQERAVPEPGRLIASHITSDTTGLEGRAVPLPGELIASHITSTTSDLQN
ncbi:hypothetical protein OF83DRAFT_156920 [Amylostereum chailletii]|nr:hypothetical protein OF83DRAFT_156920 [Amylostereum chailletii]